MITLFSFLSILGFNTTVHALEFSKEVPADIQKQFLNDMDFIIQVKGKGATPLHLKTFGIVSGDNYMKFFNKRIKTVDLSNCGNPNAVACVSPFLHPQTINLTKNYIQFSHPQVARLMVIFHEARHGEWWKLGWNHADCPVPFLDKDGKPKRSKWTGAELAGQPACDTDTLGSYGLSIVMLKNISKHCTSCTGKVRMDAALYGDNQMERMISKTAMAALKEDLYTQHRK